MVGTDCQSNLGRAPEGLGQQTGTMDFSKSLRAEDEIRVLTGLLYEFEARAT